MTEDYVKAENFDGRTFSCYPHVKRTQQDLIDFVCGGDFDVRWFFSVLKNDTPRNSKILEIGCDDEESLWFLHSIGYTNLTGIDLFPYARNLPLVYRHIQDNFLTSKLIDNDYDIIYSLSVIEHSSLGVYGDKQDYRGDIDMMAKVYRCLKKGGRAMISVPVGKKYVVFDNRWRTYSREALQSRIVQLFDIESVDYFTSASTDNPETRSWRDHHGRTGF